MRGGRRKRKRKEKKGNRKGEERRKTKVKIKVCDRSKTRRLCPRNPQRLPSGDALMHSCEISDLFVLAQSPLASADSFSLIDYLFRGRLWLCFVSGFYLFGVIPAWCKKRRKYKEKVCVCTCECIHMHACVCIYVSMYLQMDRQICIYVYVCVCVYVRLYMYVLLYTMIS